MTTTIRRREFRARLPLVWVAVFVSLVCYFAAWTGLQMWVAQTSAQMAASGASEATGLASPESLRRVALRATCLAAFFAVATALFTYSAIRYALEARRSSLKIDNDGLMLTDWMGKQRHIAFSDIEEVRVVSYGGLYKPRRIAIKARNRVTKPPLWLCEPQAFIEAVVDRAGLGEQSESWVGIRYARSAEQLYVMDDEA
ncbi:MAG: hypothetical protein JSV65_08355 [Armatimonadota bacterium]|nr:MAG: hypothetical protein JSV65_08355 [Armatimonadota bacterium]